MSKIIYDESNLPMIVYDFLFESLHTSPKDHKVQLLNTVHLNSIKVSDLCFNHIQSLDIHRLNIEAEGSIMLDNIYYNFKLRSGNNNGSELLYFESEYKKINVNTLF